MARRLAAWVVLALLGAATPAGAQSARPETEQRTRYTIEVSLDALRHTLAGRVAIEYTNSGPTALSELYLHLHANAYSGEHTIFSRDQRRLPFYSDPSGAIPSGGRTGSIDVTAITLDDRAMSFSIDEALLRVGLAEPLAAGAEATLRLDFFVRIPEFRDRLGHRDGNYAITGWFPKLAVHDANGWHTTPLRGIGEFYSETADYQVAITTAPEMVVGATGERVDSLANADGTTTTRWDAPAVRDFAWVADASYRVERATQDDITVEYLYFPRDEKAAHRGLELAHEALRFFGDRFGRYPYATFRVAEASAIGTGLGIEFPQLVLISQDLHRSASVLSAFDNTLVHEVAHQWWYGLVGNDETTEGWLDESFATYSARRFWRDTRDGEPPMLRLSGALGFLSGPTQEQVARYEYVNAARLRFDEAVQGPSAEFADLQSYVVSVYYKGSFALDMLEYQLGERTFDAVLHLYSQRFQHGVATSADFVAAAESVAGTPLGRFFEQWLSTTETCDYAVDGISVVRDSGGFLSTIALRRVGTIVMPVTLRLTLANGDTLQRTWDGEASESELQVHAPAPVRSAVVDPDLRLLETDRVNNWYPRRLHRSFNPLSVPRDAYTIAHLPYIWYDDGLELGLLLWGGYPPLAVFPEGIEREHGVSGSVGHNFKQDRTWFSAAYDTRLRSLGPRAFWGVSAAQRSGREKGTLDARWVLGQHLYRGPYQAVRVGVEHDRWGPEAKERYTEMPFEIGTIRKVSASYTYNHLYTDYNPVAGGAYSIALSRGSTAFGSDWSFTSALARVERYHRTPLGVIAVNGVHGATWGTAPLQELPSLRRHANFVAPAFERTVARHLSAAQLELRPQLLDGVLSLAFAAKGAWHREASHDSDWSAEGAVGLRLFANNPFAIQLDLPVFTATDAGSRWRIDGLVLRAGRPFSIRER